MENKIKSLQESLREFQDEFSGLERNTEGSVVNNGRAKAYKYATLQDQLKATKSLEKKHGFVIWHEGDLSGTPGQQMIKTILYHIPSGQSISLSMVLIVEPDSQRTISRMTQIRKNARLAILGIFPMDEKDDDGAKTVSQTNKTAQETVLETSRTFLNASDKEAIKNYRGIK